MFKLRLNNYRGFLNEEFDFSRVNILIGENSAGKSSIFKFLLALKQSMRTPYNREYNLTLSGAETDLGNYYETIYNHEIDKNLSFSFEFGKEYHDFFPKYTFPSIADELENEKMLEKKNEIINYLADIDNIDNSITKLSFEVSNDLSNHSNIIFNITNDAIGTLKFSFSYDENLAEQDIYLIGEAPKCEIEFKSKHYNQTFYLKEVQYEKEAFLTIVIRESLRENIEKYSGLAESEFDRLFWYIGYLLIGQNYLQMQLRKIEYINPLLHKSSERFFIEGDKKKAKQIKNIKDLIDFLDHSSVKKVLEVRLKALLKEFGIAESFFIKKENGGLTKEFIIKNNNLENNIQDVGFGVSLQLPIFAQSIVSENTGLLKNNSNEIFMGGILLIEQPEVHLHPRLQAKFIEMLLSIGNNNVYFIETHSEHIIRMLQVMVKNQKFDIKPDDLSINYFTKSKKKMTKSVHKIEEYGVLTPNLPKGFYDVSYNLALDLMD